MKILLAGGGTLGPVTPLLAVAEELRRLDPNVSFVWAGTRIGPERPLIESMGIPFHAVPAARITRYASVEWLLLPFKVAAAFWSAFQLLRAEKPDLIGAAGGYTGVPFAVLGKLLGIPVWLHQPDVRPVLSNQVAAPCASFVTVAWETTAAAFGKKAVVTGNPVRAGFAAHERVPQVRPKLLVLAGGTGSQWINRAVAQERERILAVADVVHVTGLGKNEGWKDRPGYVVREFVEDPQEMASLYASATVAVVRAGMGVLGELSAARVPAVIVPIPNSLQEANASAAEDAGAAFVVRQEEGMAALGDAVVALLSDNEKQRALSQRVGALLPSGAAERIAKRLIEAVG